MGRVPGWLDTELFPFRSRFAQVDGHDVHYVDEGSGPVLLMLHGNPTWSFVYREVIMALRDRFRCVAPDYPGFGLSTAAPGYGHRPADHAAVIAGLVDHLELDEITLVVQDWGGPIGLWVAEQRPAAFAGLVIANTWAWPVNGDPHFEIFSWVMGGPVGRRLIGRFNLFVNAMIPAGHRRRRLSAAEMAQYRKPLATPARRHATAVFPREIIAGRGFLATVQAGLPALSGLPSLIVWADRDVAFRDRERRRWEALLPDHTTVVLTGAGHYLQSDAPAEFAAAIDDWVRSRPAVADLTDRA